MKLATTIAAFFFSFCAMVAITAWCSGYNFDHRSSDVGFSVGMTIGFGGVVSALLGLITNGKL